MSEAIASLLVSLGLGSPITRGIFGASVFAIPLILKTPLAYYKVSDGVYLPKQFTLTASSEVPADQKTIIPWFIYPILGAILFGLFL